MTTEPRTRPVPARYRTLGDALRAFSADELTQLLTLRPDLLEPAPADLTELASRSTVTASITRALDGLDAWQYVVAEALAALPDPGSVDAAAELLGQSRDAVEAAVDALRARAVVWGDDPELHLVRPARAAFEPYPGGLAAPSARPLSDRQIEAALAECGPDARAVLDRLLWSPAGAVRRADRVIDVATARSPIEQLLSRALLRPIDADTVVLPREVAWWLRGRRFSVEPVTADPPGRPTTDPASVPRRDAALVDRAAAGAAHGLLHDLELVVHTVEESPYRLLRSGGLASRDLAALSRALNSDTAYATFVVECAAATDLIAPGGGGLLLATTAYDRWAAAEPAQRWWTVAHRWLETDRFFLRATEPGARALGPEAAWPAASRLRRTLLDLIAAGGSGLVVDVPGLVEALCWHSPRLAPRESGGAGPAAATAVAWTWREAAWLGLAALGTVTAFAPALAQQPTLPESLVRLFPTPVSQIVLQADLTAVAAGPLAAHVAVELRLLADQESRGGGGVFRFSAGSLSRAFAAGRTAEEILVWLRAHSATELPQALSYLVADAGRRHHDVRIGPAGCYVVVQDEAQAATLLAHPAAPGLGLRRIAPGVLIAAVDADELAALVLDVGHVAAVENAAGQILAAPPRSRVTRPDPKPSSGAGHPASAAALARRLLAADRRPRRADTDATELTAETLTRLRAATQQARPVRVVYVAADGSHAERDVAPLDLAAGSVRAVDRASAEVITIPLARISSVSPSGPGPLE